MYPAIGMVDVEFPHGNFRFPVEDLQRIDPEVVGVKPPESSSVPGGVGTVPVSPGPPPEAKGSDRVAVAQMARRVAEAHVKRALYWAAKDRHYRATQSELESGTYLCPKCKTPLKRARYKRKRGQSFSLYGCPQCMFLIKTCDIMGDPDYTPDPGVDLPW